LLFFQYFYRLWSRWVFSIAVRIHLFLFKGQHSLNFLLNKLVLIFLENWDLFLDFFINLLIKLIVKSLLNFLFNESVDLLFKIFLREYVRQLGCLFHWWFWNRSCVTLKLSFVFRFPLYFFGLRILRRRSSNLIHLDSDLVSIAISWFLLRWYWRLAFVYWIHISISLLLLPSNFDIACTAWLLQTWIRFSSRLVNLKLRIFHIHWHF